MNSFASPQHAIIPAAGKGSRMYPTTRWIPKELLPIGEKPMLLHVLEEAVQAGITSIVVVSSPDKTPIQNMVHELDQLKGPVEKDQVQLAYQQTPDGLADALRIGWRKLGSPEKPLLSLLPDNIFLGSPPTPASQLLKQFKGTENYLTVLHPVTEDQLDRYDYTGMPKLELIQDRRYRLLKLPEKNQDGGLEHEFMLRTAGRSVITPTFFEVLDDLSPELRSDGKELDDVPVVRQMISQGEAVEGLKINQRLLDVGHPAGYSAAHTDHSLHSS